MHGKRLGLVPRVAERRPSAEFGRWHNEKRFVGK